MTTDPYSADKGKILVLALRALTLAAVSVVGYYAPKVIDALNHVAVQEHAIGVLNKSVESIQKDGSISMQIRMSGVEKEVQGHHRQIEEIKASQRSTNESLYNISRSITVIENEIKQRDAR